MAFISISQRPSVFDRLRALTSALRQARARRKLYLTAVRELSALSDRELEDLGIARFDIEAIARQHTYGE